MRGGFSLDTLSTIVQLVVELGNNNGSDWKGRNIPIDPHPPRKFHAQTHLEWPLSI